MMTNRLTTTIWLAIPAVLLLAGGAYFLSTDQQTTVQVEAGRPGVIRFEAAGVKYAGWPEVDIKVNDKVIRSMPIDSQIRREFTVEIPGDVSTVEKIEVVFTNFTGCQSRSACENRKIMLRSMYLDDEKLENGEAVGEKNLPSLLQAPGSIVWRIDQ